MPPSLGRNPPQQPCQDPDRNDVEIVRILNRQLSAFLRQFKLLDNKISNLTIKTVTKSSQNAKFPILIIQSQAIPMKLNNRIAERPIFEKTFYITLPTVLLMIIAMCLLFVIILILAV